MDKKKDNRKTSYILTKETLGMTILLFCLVLAVILLTNDFVFLDLGKAVCTFMYGTFGYASYFLVFLLAYLGERLVFEKKLKINFRVVLCVSATVTMLFFLFHTVTTAWYSLDNGYGSYLKQCYLNAADGYKGYSFGGVLSGLVVYPILRGTTAVGAYVIFSLLTAGLCVLSFFVIKKVYLSRLIAKAGEEAEQFEEDMQAEESKPMPDNLYTVNEEHEIVTNVRAGGARRTEAGVQAEEAAVEDSAAETAEKSKNDKFSKENLGRKILFEPGEFAAESYRRNMIYNENSYFNHPVRDENAYKQNFASSQENTQPEETVDGSPFISESYTTDYSSGVENSESENVKPSYLYGDAPVESLTDHSFDSHGDGDGYSSYTMGERAVSESEKTEEPLQRNDDYNSLNLGSTSTVPKFTQPEEILDEGREDFEGGEEFADEESEQDTPEPEPVPKEEPSVDRSPNIFNIFSSSNPRLGSERKIEPDPAALNNPRRETGRENIFDESDDADDSLFGEDSPLVSGDRIQRVRGVDADTSAGITPTAPVRPVREAPAPVGPVQAQEPEVKKSEEKPKHVWKKYLRPPLELLDDYPENSNVNPGEIEDSKRVIVETLNNFRIASHIADVIVGPAITRYDVIIEDKTNIKNALKYKEAIAMALMKENVNAYLNYSKGAISIEVPNSSRTIVGLKGLLASSVFLNAKPNSLTFGLGKNVEGKVICPDITKMPHLLVAGTTGSGKSICLSALIVSLLYRYGPEELRFILVDPKQVEFISYDKLPHLMINEIIYDVDKAIKALNWAIKEMENRYQLFKEMTEKGIATKNLSEYNSHLPEGEEKLPKIVIILDEFGDLMLQAKKDIESRIIRLVQKARACGIHLILATQRPSVDCITGLIKSNLPTRIGFKVNSFDDARTIFDIGGAEKLLGKGDLYFRSAESPDLARIQGCFIDTHEVQKVTDYIKQNNETYFDQSVSDFINTVEEEPTVDISDDSAGGGDVAKVDDTFIKALKYCVTSNQASVSMIQRRFPIGYMKACKIIDWMENMNYITQSEGSKPRKVILSHEEFIQRYGDVDD